MLAWPAGPCAAERASVGGIDAAGHLLRDLTVVGSTLREASFANAELERATFRDTTFVDAELPAALLRSPTMERVRFRSCDLSGLLVVDGRMHDVEFVDCRLDGASFRSVAVVGVSFLRCGLRDLDVASMDLEGVRFVSCDLQRVQFDTVGSGPPIVRTGGRVALRSIP